MMDVQQVVDEIFRQFQEQAQAAGIEFSGYDQESGAFYVPAHDGSTVQISLHGLIDYYLETRDENAVSDFVRKIQSVVTSPEDPTWEEAKDKIYLCPYNHEDLMGNPYAQEVTGYFYTMPVYDTPDASLRIMPKWVEEWGITEEALRRQALQNGERLLADATIGVGEVEGHPLGAFQIEDRNLSAACLFAPGFKEKVSPIFGWPVYFIFPEKTHCFIFGQDHYEYFASSIGELVTKFYHGPRRVSPELMEYGDDGVKSLHSWMDHGGFTVSFDEEP